MTKITHVTADLLREHNACDDQIELFVQTFGQSAKIGPRNWSKAHKAGLHLLWLVRLLPRAARAEYEKVTDAARAEYEKVTAPARAEYVKVTAPAWAEYVKVRDAALLSALMEEMA